MRRRQLRGLGLLALVTAVLVTAALWRSAAQPLTGVPVPAPFGSMSSSPNVSSSSSVSPSPSPAGTPGATASPSGSPTLSTAPAPTPSARTVVVLGDGYTVRSGWADELAAVSGRTVVTMAEDGMGYRVAPKACAQKPCVSFGGAASRVAAAEPDAVVVVGGDADGDFKLDPFAVESLRALRKALPDATIVATPPLSSRFPRPYWITLHGKSIQKVSGQERVTWLDTSSVSGKPASYDGTSLTPEASWQFAALVGDALP